MKRGDAKTTRLVPLEEFKRFLRRIVAVPKKEIDRQLAHYQRQRRTKKRPR